MSKPTLRVLLDENVPVSVAGAFSAKGHQAILHSAVLPAGAKDVVVARTAILNEAILIAVDRDMARLNGRYGRVDPAFRNLHLIKIGCPEPMATSRIDQAMSLIELEWAFVIAKRSRRLYVEIGKDFFRTFR